MMNHQPSMWRQWTLPSLILLVLSGCTLKASTESLTDATTNFSSSTTPGAWVTVDGLLKPNEKITAFVTINNKNLHQNMAQGDGEYLTALGVLLQYSEKELPMFKAMAQAHVQQLHHAEPMSSENLLAFHPINKTKGRASSLPTLISPQNDRTNFDSGHTR